MKTKKPTFEEAYHRLEEIVRELEAGGQTLDQLLGLFEEGMRLSQECAQALDSIQTRVEQIVKQADGSITTVPFESAD
jgi:exodeoxyribonuclease VII small subunit